MAAQPVRSEGIVWKIVWLSFTLLFGVWIGLEIRHEPAPQERKSHRKWDLQEWLNPPWRNPPDSVNTIDIEGIADSSSATDGLFFETVDDFATLSYTNGLTLEITNADHSATETAIFIDEGWDCILGWNDSLGNQHCFDENWNHTVTPLEAMDGSDTIQGIHIDTLR